MIDIDQAIKDCMNFIDVKNCPFSEWEKSFILVINSWNYYGKELTPKQCEFLKNIWEKVE